jgi:hypothetical protein
MKSVVVDAQMLTLIHLNAVHSCILPQFSIFNVYLIISHGKGHNVQNKIQIGDVLC